MGKLEGRIPLRGGPGSPQESPNRSQVPPGAQTQPPIMCDFRLLINGRLVEGADTLDVINPATGRVLAAAPRADLVDLA